LLSAENATTRLIEPELIDHTLERRLVPEHVGEEQHTSRLVDPLAKKSVEGSSG
jgi:hypothetical protein